MRRPIAALALVAALTITGCGGSSEPDPGAESAATETIAREAPAAELRVAAPSSRSTSTTRRRYTLRGTGTPGAVLTEDSWGIARTIPKSGRWSEVVELDRGRNEFGLYASLDDSIEDDDSDMTFVTITRKRTEAEIARTIAKRKARQEARRQRVMARRAAAAQRMMQEDAELIERIAGGSGEKMTKAIAQEILARCESGAVNDFDVCFEAGYVVGREAAGSAIDKYE